MTIEFRPERPEDTDAIRRILGSSFPSIAEADLVDRLRESGNAAVCLVAVDRGSIVGHILFSPVRIAEWSGLGLGPLSVVESHRRQGVGAGLVEEGLAACRCLGVPYVVVLGEPGYYRRFGFRTASEVGLGNNYGVDEEFMVIELCPGGLPKTGGLVNYGAEFSAFT